MDEILCDELIEGLKYLADDTKCDDEMYKSTLEAVNTILKAPNTPKFKETNDNMQGKMIAALLTLLTEIFRRGIDIKQLVQYLRQYNFNNDRAKMIIKLYEHIKPIITVELDSIGHHHPYITGADWSLNYVMKDSSNEKVNTLEYLVDLHTQENGGKEDKIQFTCSLEEMQDLTLQLKEALKHMEKISSSN